MSMTLNCAERRVSILRAQDVQPNEDVQVSRYKIRSVQERPKDDSFYFLNVTHHCNNIATHSSIIFVVTRKTKQMY